MNEFKYLKINDDCKMLVPLDLDDRVYVIKLSTDSLSLIFEEMFQDAKTAKAEQENTGSSRAKCGYKVTKEGARQPCGSEEGLVNVKGRSPWGGTKETPVCPKHILDAWRSWNVDNTVPIDLPTKK